MKISPTVITSLGHYLDIARPFSVEVLIKRDGKVVWINVDGICRLRACSIGKLTVVDERRKASGRHNQEG